MDLLFPSGFFSGGRNTSWLPTGISNSGGDAGPTGATVGAGPEATAPGGLPSGVMDTFLATAGRSSPLMQVLLFVYRVLGAQLGLDPSVLLTLLGFLWGLSKIGSQLYVHVVTLIDRYFACSITIPDSDSIYDHLMEWLSHQKSIRNNRFLMAKTVYKTAWEDEEGIEKSLSRTGGESGDQYLNFSNHAASQSPTFVPAMGTTAFWHKGHYFFFYRKKETFMASNSWRATKDSEEIRISCFGRSAEPIKVLMEDAKKFYYSDTHQKTSIYRPRTKEMRRDYSMWQQVAQRPVRPMRTIVLDGNEKESVLADINEYLHPATPRWYASRGIPLRRGYLFHGPPGTGKTSFSFALAGVFGIDIYVISMQDMNVTEEDLAVLFTRLPRRCVVLLEDIDTAGLSRDNDSDEDDEDEKEGDKDNDDGVKEKEPVVNGVKATADQAAPSTNGVTKAKKTKAKKKKSKKQDSSDDESDDSDDSDSDDSRKKKSKKSKSKSKKSSRTRKSRSGKASWVNGLPGRLFAGAEKISLSGLLNAIDGVASHEGRVLIMTTNKPESLDEALIRPGRVDMQVSFKNASSKQSGELFYRMYENVAKPTPVAGSKATWVVPQAEGEPAPWLTTAQGEPLSVTADELKNISQNFAHRIPENVFSPAEIQGFLLKRKKTPRKALEEVDAWVDATKKQREANSKVVTVQ